MDAIGTYNLIVKELQKDSKALHNPILAMLSADLKKHLDKSESVDLNLFSRQNKLIKTHNIWINVYRNASGWLWSLQKADGGTDLGWCNFNRGDQIDSNTFSTNLLALEDALNICEGFPRENFNLKYLKHWGNFADKAINEYINNKE